MMAIGSLVPAFISAVVTPRISGERLGESPEFLEDARLAVEMIPEMAPLAGAVSALRSNIRGALTFDIDALHAGSDSGSKVCLAGKFGPRPYRRLCSRS